MAANRGPSAAFYVLFGGESFLLDRGIEMAKRWPGRRVVELNASEGLSEPELMDVLEETGIDNEPRTIILEDAHKLKESKGKLLRAYVENKSISDTNEVLVVVSRNEKLSELWQVVAARGKSIEHKKFKPWPDKTGKNDYEKWLETEAKRVGMSLDQGVPEFIFQMTGDNLYRLHNELRKLYLLVGNGNRATKQHVSSIITVSPSALPRDVVDAAFSKNLKQAMNSLSILFRNEGDSAAVRVVYGMMKEAEKFLGARYMLDNGRSDDEIASWVNMHPYRCKISFLPHLKKHDQKSLVRLMRQLCKLDRDVKSSALSKRTLVELTVLSIAA